MAGVSLSGRVGLILLVAVFAVMITLIAASYLAAGAGRSAELPSPARLEALATLFEQAPASERAVILEAVTTSRVTVRIEPERLEAAPLPTLLPMDEAVLAEYRAILERRPVTVTPLERNRPVLGLMASALNAVEFRLGLDTGETLVVATESPFVVAPFGLPVGFGAGVFGILIALVTLIMLHREFRPLTRLAAAVERVDPAGEAVALPQIRARSPELRALVAAFERLQGRLSALIHGRMALVGGIQHDVRTFATRLRLRVDKIADPEDRQRAVADITDMIALLDDALLASRAGASELEEELVDLAALVEAEVSDRVAAGAPVQLETAGREATVLGDRLALRRIVANLLDNAIRYGHRAHLTLSLSDTTAVLSVDDEGPGIAPAERALLLEPFTRNEASRARRTGGAGLGLAVVRSIAEAHEGSIAIEDAPTGGARLVLSLPLFRP